MDPEEGQTIAGIGTRFIITSVWERHLRHNNNKYPTKLINFHFTPSDAYTCKVQKYANVHYN